VIVAAAILFALAFASFLAGEARWNFRWWIAAAAFAFAAIVLVLLAALAELIRR
jgi:hypothetical protein